MVAWEQMNSSVKGVGSMVQYINRISANYVPFGLLIVLAVFFVVLLTAMKFGIERAFVSAAFISFIIAVLLGVMGVLDSIFVILFTVLLGVAMAVLWLRTRSPIY